MDVRGRFQRRDIGGVMILPQGPVPSNRYSFIRLVQEARRMVRSLLWKRHGQQANAQPTPIFSIRAGWQRWRQKMGMAGRKRCHPCSGLHGSQ